MLIDATHRTWILAAIILLAAAALGYIPYALGAPHGPRGGSAVGLTYGIVGFTLMVFAGLLSFRRKVPAWRIGRAQTWMRGHLWLGLVSFPLILFHAGFRFGGPLTRILMWLFIAVMVSGIAGAALQHVLPRVMLREVPMETIYEQIGHVREQLRAEADKLISSVYGDLQVAETLNGAGERAKEGAVSSVGVPVDVGGEGREHLRDFYATRVRPFLQGLSREQRSLADPKHAAALFNQVRRLVHQELRATLDELEGICEEERQLRRQERLHRALHGWLLVHVPLSFLLLTLGALHALFALRY